MAGLDVASRSRLRCVALRLHAVRRQELGFDAAHESLLLLHLHLVLLGQLALIHIAGLLHVVREDAAARGRTEAAVGSSGQQRQQRRQQSKQHRAGSGTVCTSQRCAHNGRAVCCLKRSDADGRSRRPRNWRRCRAAQRPRADGSWQRSGAVQCGRRTSRARLNSQLRSWTAPHRSLTLTVRRIGVWSRRAPHRTASLRHSIPVDGCIVIARVCECASASAQMCALTPRLPPCRRRARCRSSSLAEAAVGL